MTQVITIYETCLNVTGASGTELVFDVQQSMAHVVVTAESPEGETLFSLWFANHADRARSARILRTAIAACI
jgi:hypothetical protein